VISHAQHQCPYIPCWFKNADLLWAISQLCRTCSIQLEFHYVAGHQDVLMRFKDLPLLAQLNIQVDRKQALHVLGLQAASPASPMVLPLPSLTWALVIQSVPISSDPHLAILDHVSYQLAIPYRNKKGQLSTQSAELVDWTLLEGTLKSSPPTYWMWLSKFASGHSMASRTMAHWLEEVGLSYLSIVSFRG